MLTMLRFHCTVAHVPAWTMLPWHQRAYDCFECKTMLNSVSAPGKGIGLVIHSTERCSAGVPMTN